MVVFHSSGDISKPEEIFHVIEHFCLGRRRLHLFGTDNSIRPGLILIPHTVLYTLMGNPLEFPPKSIF